jgi:hypothetical protein
MKIALSTRSLVRRTTAVIGCICALGAMSCSDEDDEDETTQSNQPGGEDTSLSFFVTSSTQDGNLGGLAGADRICQDLAAAAGAGSKTWRAYLSAAGTGTTPVHAKDRIGTGPWYNANGVKVASTLAELHGGMSGNADVLITEKKEKINGQWNGTPPNQHDIMTGSNAQGELLISADPMTGTTTCADWTSNTLQPGPQVGHTDGMGPMMNTAEMRFTSWNGGHAAAGCSTADLAARGGAGRFYCFAL